MRSLRSSSLRLPLLATALGLAAAAHADPFVFANWSATSATTATTTLATTNGSITATLTGSYTSVLTGQSIFNPASSFTGDIVGNAPTSNATAIRLDNPSTFTLTFSQPVTNLAYDLWSVGSPIVNVSYAFTQPFSLVAGGPNQDYGGGALTKTGNTVTGNEGNGTLLFTGTYSAISWNVTGTESYQAFTIGVRQAQTPTPEPASFAALGAGALVLLRRRRRA